MRGIPIKSIVALVLLVILGIASLNFFESLDAGELMVVQSPFGSLTWHKEPGIKWQGFGKVTKYHKRSQFWFSNKDDQGDPKDQSIQIRFNDGGHGSLSGSIAWEMPLDDKQLTEIHTRYGSQEAVEQQLIRTVIEKAVYMTGPLMSSKESAAERRNDLLTYIEDQVQNGIYRTETREEKQIDQMTGKEKTVKIVQLVKDQNGLFSRADESPLKGFGIKTFNPSLNNIRYANEVGAQIAEQQKAIMQVQTAIADAKRAEQAAITAEKEGQAKAAQAKWEQEVIKAREITQAQQRLEVAQLETKAAEQQKQKDILLGEGEAARKRAAMSADGALDKKLNAWLESQKYWADAFKNHQGPLVPSVIMSGTGPNNAATTSSQLVEMLGIKAAHDLSLNFNMRSNNGNGKE